MFLKVCQCDGSKSSVYPVSGKMVKALWKINCFGKKKKKKNYSHKEKRSKLKTEILLRIQ